MNKGFGQIIRRYATALYELANDNKQMADLRLEANALATAFDKSVIDFFVNPQFELGKKREVLDTLAEKIKLTNTMKMFLNLMLDNGRMAIAPQVLKSFVEKAEEALKIARVEVVSAQNIDAGELNQMKDVLAVALKRTVEISQSVDPSLKAGSVIRFGNTIVDASLRSRLASLKDSLSVGV